MLLKIILFPFKLILRLVALIIGVAIFCVVKVISLVVSVIGAICKVIGVLAVLATLIYTVFWITAISDPATPPDSPYFTMKWYGLAFMYGIDALLYFLPDLCAGLLGFVFAFAEMLISLGWNGRITKNDNDYGDYYNNAQVLPMPQYEKSDIPILRFSKIHEDFTKESAAFSGTFNALCERNTASAFSERASEIAEEYSSITARFNSSTEEVMAASDDSSIREISADAKYQLHKLRDLHDLTIRLSKLSPRIQKNDPPPAANEQSAPKHSAPRGFDPFAGVKSAADLKKRYAKLCQAYHPDVSGTESTEQMQFINAEYKRLMKEFT
jgi:hypothetical protein